MFLRAEAVVEISLEGPLLLPIETRREFNDALDAIVEGDAYFAGLYCCWYVLKGGRWSILAGVEVTRELETPRRCRVICAAWGPCSWASSDFRERGREAWLARRSRVIDMLAA